MSQGQIITRFPPSPTGYLHIGGARTALFNWLFARQNNGRFILRIEDTDTDRSTHEATTAIVESMEWLGLDWDEGPYFQSKRYDIYNEAIDRLLESGGAYHCHCSSERLKQKREEALEKGLKPKYDGTCRDRRLGPAEGSVVRLRTPLSGTTGFHDLVKGPLRFDNRELDDLILRRSNGSPTYHMAVVADDINLGISHVIRGDDHVNNTPRQIQIYRALGVPLPEYAHVPMILGPDKTRLSKRHGAMSVLQYRDRGYMPHALLNALARLGWSHGDQEKFSREELIEKFSLKNVGKAAGVFNSEKLLDLNAWYIRNTEDEILAQAVEPFQKQAGLVEAPDTDRRVKAVGTLKARSKTLVELAEKSLFYFHERVRYEEKADNDFLRPGILGLVEALRDDLSRTGPFTHGDLEAVFKDFLDRHGVKLKDIAQPLRVALTGGTVSPGIFEVMEVLGKKEVLKRLDRAMEHIKAKG